MPNALSAFFWDLALDFLVAFDLGADVKERP
jgi:hypothetical protein